jgi:hypothetical protein
MEMICLTITGIWTGMEVEATADFLLLRLMMSLISSSIRRISSRDTQSVTRETMKGVGARNSLIKNFLLMGHLQNKW